jgi:hypothetical protein
MRHNLCIMLQIVVAHLVMMVPSRLSDATKKWCAIHYINQQNALYKIYLSSTSMSQFMLSTSFYMFQHQSAILRKFDNNKGS